MKGPMDIVVLRIDKSVSDKATLVLLGIRRVISTLDLLALCLVRNIRVGFLLVEMVAMGMVRVVI